MIISNPRRHVVCFIWWYIALRWQKKTALSKEWKCLHRKRKRFRGSVHCCRMSFSTQWITDLWYRRGEPWPFPISSSTTKMHHWHMSYLSHLGGQGRGEHRNMVWEINSVSFTWESLFYRMVITDCTWRESLWEHADRLQSYDKPIEGNRHKATFTVG